MNKRNVICYLSLFLILSFILVILFFLDGSFTGFAVYEQGNQSAFDEGVYNNVEWNGSAVVLSSGNLIGIYTSKIFDAGDNASWNNISYSSSSPDIELMFCVDGGGDIYKSTNFGINWAMTQEDYGRTTATTDMFSNDNYIYTLSSSGNEVWRSANGSGFAVIYNEFSTSPLVANSDKFVSNQNLYLATGNGEVFKSSDDGENWVLKGDANAGATNNPKGITIDSNGYIYVVDGSGSVFKSINDGINWTEINEGYGGGSATAGMEIDSEDNLYILLAKKVYKSSDSGLNWTIINDSFTSYSNNGMKILIDINDNFFIADAVGRIFKSADSGVSWNEIGDCNGGASKDILGLTDFVSSSNLTYYARSCDDSECSGESWVEVSNPLDLGLSDNRYFQYKAEFSTGDLSITPSLESIEIDYTLPPEIVYVDDDFNSETEGWGVTSFNNIDEAVGAVQTGGKIYVSEGIYNEKLTISKSLALIGDGYETTIINGGGTGNVIEIITEYVNISGFNITGSGTNWGNSGIYFNSVGNSFIENNYLFKNHVGISLIGSASNKIHSNYITDSIEYGLYSNNWATQNNYIYNNYFGNEDNFYAASQPPNLAYFNITKMEGTNIVGGEYIGGNYWNDYSGTNRGDGFGSTSYNVGGNYYDYLPLLDNSAPVISLISPQEGATYGNNESLALEFSVSDSDGDLDSCWYNINEGDNVSISNCLNSTFDVPGDGSYVLNIHANDSQGEFASDSVSFSVQVGAPTIFLHFPVEEYLNYSENIQFNYTPTDIDLDSCELWGNFNGNFELNQTENSPTSGVVNTFNLDLTDGPYLWNIKCNDSIGNSAFNENKTFYVDTVAPEINISEPSGQKNSRTGIPLEFYVSDNNLDSCWYNVYRGESLEITNTSVNCYSGSTTLDVTLDANFVLNFYANDSAGNIRHSSSSFAVSTSSSGTTIISGGGGGGGTSTSIIITNGTISLDVEKINDLIVEPTDVKKIEWFAKNTGTSFLNDCKVKGTGIYSSWILSEEVKDLSAGEEHVFSFDLNIPEDIESGDYALAVSLECKEISKSIDFSAEILEKEIEFSLISVEREAKTLVKIVYSLNDLSNTDQDVELQFLLFDSDNNALLEVKESKSILADSKNQFELLIPIDQSLRGELILLVNLNSKTYSTFVQENVILGSLIGFTMFEDFGDIDNVSSITLILIFLVFAFFIMRRIFSYHKQSKLGEKKKDIKGYKRIKGL
jgi:photosystem II stability/assembly factor-like uncharacterized protein